MFNATKKKKKRKTHYCPFIIINICLTNNIISLLIVTVTL